MATSNKLKLSDFDIEHVYHCTPLHYFLFIARSCNLKSKTALLRDGYADHHFRSTSKNCDIRRGFQDYLHLSLIKHPDILKAKLKGGFPHVEIVVPSATFDNLKHDLCRFNISRTRRLRYGNKKGSEESPSNGKYYNSMKIPIARTEGDKKLMLKHNKGKMIELLIKNELQLPSDVEIFCFSDADKKITEDIIKILKLPWQVSLDNSLNYNYCSTYADLVNQFLREAFKDGKWKGDGLEYDRV